MTTEFYDEMFNYYDREWHGSYVPPSGLAELLHRAGDIVNNAIVMSGYTVETVPEYMQDEVRRAICAETEYLYGHGGTEALSGGEGAGSMSLGAFSYSGSSDALSADRLSCLCAQARAFLAHTGLLRKGVCAI